MVTTEDKCGEIPQMFGKTKGDYIMIMPPIKLKTLHWAKPFILILLITIVTYWMKYYRMNDKEVQHIQ